jgi:hypothetical protein
VKKLTSMIMLCLLGMSSLIVNAAEAPPPPGITEVFLCNYNDGKDADDLRSARDYYVKQAAKAKLTPRFSVAMHLFKGSVPADFLWVTFHESLNTFGADADAGLAAAELTSANARFDTVANCEANVATMRPVFQSPAVLNGRPDPTFASTSACNARGPMNAGDRQDLLEHINDVLGGMDSFKTAFSFAMQPMTSTATSADVYFFNIHDSAAGWANRMSELSGSAEGQSLRRHFEAVLECSTSLWRTERMVGERPSAGS